MKASEYILFDMLKSSVMTLKEAIRENYKEIYNVDEENMPPCKTVSQILEMASDVCFELEVKKEIGECDASGSMDS